MNQRKLAEVALIIFGVYALLRSISLFFGVLSNQSVKMFSSWALFSTLLPLFLPSLVFFIAAGILFWYARPISCKLFELGESQERTDTLQIHECYRLALSVTGVVLLFWVVLPGLLNGTSTLLFPLELKEPEKDPFGVFKSKKNIFEGQAYRLFGTLAEGGIAIYLVIRARQLSDFIIRVQNRQFSKIS